MIVQDQIWIKSSCFLNYSLRLFFYDEDIWSRDQWERAAKKKEKQQNLDQDQLFCLDNWGACSFLTFDSKFWKQIFPQLAGSLFMVLPTPIPLPARKILNRQTIYLQKCHRLVFCICKIFFHTQADESLHDATVLHNGRGKGETCVRPGFASFSLLPPPHF